MAQTRKDDVEQRILDAAVELFARGGYASAGMAAIAKAAGVSAGNLYRYFANKEDLFAAAIPPDFVAELEARLKRRTETYGRAEYTSAAEALLHFTLEDRKRIVVLLAHNQGSAYDGFDERLVESLSKTAAGYAVRKISGAERETLALIYRGFLKAMAAILATQENEDVIRDRIAHYTRYHLAGLEAFLR